MNPLEYELKKFRHRERDEYDKDLLYWAHHGTRQEYDALVVRLLLEATLDTRDIMNQILNQPPLAVSVSESPEEIIERWKDRL